MIIISHTTTIEVVAVTVACITVIVHIFMIR